MLHWIHFFLFLDEEGEGEEGPLDDDIVIQDEDAILDESPADCCPDPCYKKFPFLAGDDDSPFWQGWANLRLKTFQLIENKYFETAVITMILLSSLALVSFSPNIFFLISCTEIVCCILNKFRPII